MKKRIGLLLGVLLLIGATGCEKEPQKQDMTGAYNVYEGYLTVKDNQLIVDEIKFIDLADKYWIDSLNLAEEDMTNGYYIYNPSDEKLTFTLNDETRYDFYDTGALFISEDNETRMYTTQEVSELLRNLMREMESLGKHLLKYRCLKMAG